MKTHKAAVIRGAHNVGNMAPALSDELQHSVSSGRLSLDLNCHHTKEQDLQQAPAIQELCYRGLSTFDRKGHAQHCMINRMTPAL